MSKIWKPEDAHQREPTAPAPNSKGPRYGVVDTTFSTVDMGAIAVATLREIGIPPNRIVRRTVPGFKDLAVAAKQMVERDNCAIVIACGMPGPEPIDKQCGHEASLALGQAQLMTSTHILEVFVHMDEARTDAELVAIAQNRVAEHAINAYWLLERPEELVKRAGTGQRQGFSDLGPADPKRAEAAHLRPATR
ncbi:MAG: riboflavin synthase [Thermoplasmatota archaeon]